MMPDWDLLEEDDIQAEAYESVDWNEGDGDGEVWEDDDWEED